MKKNGYTLPELLIVLGIISLIAIVSIVKISFAFSDINNDEEIKKEEENLIGKAALIYSNQILDDLKNEKHMYISGVDLINAGILADNDEYKALKIKLNYDEKNDSVQYEVVNKNGD